MTTVKDLILSQQIENLLVARNLRGMKTVQPALQPGYCMRVARMMLDCTGTVLISTGFPVKDTFETDGPLGAIALYRAMEALGSTPVLVCGNPLAKALGDEYRVHRLDVNQQEGATQGAQRGHAQQVIDLFQPELVITIELPGRAEDGCYYNMRGVDISSLTICFDDVLNMANCPTVSIGDGGNEVGMGNIADALSSLDIISSATTCDELIIADVSNWAAHGLIAMMSHWTGEDMLKDWDNRAVLKYLSQHGSVDGLTGNKTLTEDGLPCENSERLIQELRRLTGFCQEEE
jgi:D-glutamate cyclase-like, C-terminal